MSDETNERRYIEGRKAAARSMLLHVLSELDCDGTDPLLELALKTSELSATRTMLRQICDEHGDNDWSDDLYLPDALEKHLWRHLDEQATKGPNR